jgi:hypothetical protein
MKRIALGLGLAAAAAVALPLCLTRAEPPAPVPTPRPPACPQATDPLVTYSPAPTQAIAPAPSQRAVHVRLRPRAVPSLRPAPVNPAVADLAAALAETKSKGAFVAAVLALAEMGPEARPAIPAILRHGERLGIFDYAFDGDSPKKGAAGRAVAQALAAIAAGVGPGAPDYPPAAAAYADCPKEPCYGTAAAGMTEVLPPPHPVESCSTPAKSTPTAGCTNTRY